MGSMLASTDLSIESPNDRRALALNLNTSCRCKSFGEVTLGRRNYGEYGDEFSKQPGEESINRIHTQLPTGIDCHPQKVKIVELRGEETASEKGRDRNLLNIQITCF
jgi:hypothetical protein